MSYIHLTTTERVKIETYLELGMSIRSIARRLGRQPSTVSREIRRNPDYVAERAQKRYEKAKTNCGAKTKLDDTMRRTIVGKLRATWSPEQIVGRLYTGIIAFSTIYRWIYAGRIDVPLTVLRQKGKRQKPIADRTAASMEGAIHAVHAAFPEGTFRTATTDRGKEFSCHENANGLLREFFPKGSDFATVGQGEIVDALAKINGRPRKCLGWKTAHEAFAEEVLRLI
ncbi:MULTISPECIES: helix-turn-helix domain-containing protein [Exiguobacterium]|uniref:helix-turn-helix domain-containing protein n=1 Tax=Exiguobacterium TaxID=33986 RepID=UPI0010399116|nr:MULTISPECIES: helix-turn-helix domain-containing protein [Exiguobacterium]TCI69679.1 IS30 family transposase [Exiguobacterium sp. IPCI3]TCI78977.1 IS30 family transposase [Exiguobacterium sp. IPCH1]TCI81564.1 IS30 family transposase [Exiguobacterium sp. IPBC4]